MKQKFELLKKTLATTNEWNRIGNRCPHMYHKPMTLVACTATIPSKQFPTTTIIWLTHSQIDEKRNIETKKWWRVYVRSSKIGSEPSTGSRPQPENFVATLRTHRLFTKKSFILKKETFCCGVFHLSDLASICSKVSYLQRIK